jgi:hypothetical protein
MERGAVGWTRERQVECEGHAVEDKGVSARRDLVLGGGSSVVEGKQCSSEGATTCRSKQ